jgi:hypothetical protein
VALPGTTAANPGFTVAWNFDTQQYVIDSVSSRGGYVELDGDVASTGAGQIRVLGGFPTVNINNTTGYTVVVDGVDLSQHGAGVVLINDSAGGAPCVGTEMVAGGSGSCVGSSSDIAGTSPGNLYTTLYQWTPNGVELSTDLAGSSAAPTTTLISNTSTRELSGQNVSVYDVPDYQPNQELRFAWVEQNWTPNPACGGNYTYNCQPSGGTSTTSYDAQTSSSLFGFIPTGSSNISWQTTQVNGQPTITEPGGRFFYLAPNTTAGNAEYTYQQTVLAADGPVQTVYQYSTCNFSVFGLCLASTYHVKYSQTNNYFVTNEDTANAHRPIEVDFLGQPTGTISINSNAGVVVNGPILNPTGITTIDATGPITIGPQGQQISGRVLNLDSNAGLGSALQPLPIQVADIPFAGSSTQTSPVQLNTPKYSATSDQSAQVALTFGLTVRVADTYNTSLGTPGRVYSYSGPASGATVSLGTQDYLNGADWTQLTATSDDNVQVIGVGGSVSYYTYLGPAADVTLGNLSQYSNASLWAPVTQEPGLNAVSSSGAIYLDDVSGALPVQQVIAGSGQNVVVTSESDITAAFGPGPSPCGGSGQAACVSQMGQVSGEAVTLDAGGATAQSDGTSPFPGVIGEPGSPIVIASGQSMPAGDVNLRAKGSVYVEENGGDMWLNSLLATGGDAWVKVDNGSLYDANTTVFTDPRTYAQLSQTVYASLQLTNPNVASEQEDSFATGKEQDYTAYWQYKSELVCTNPSDPSTCAVEFPAQTAAAYIDYYEGLNPPDTPAQAEAAVATLEASATVQYNSLAAEFTSYFSANGLTFPTSYDGSRTGIGSDLTVAGGTAATSATADFFSDDVGKSITIGGTQHLVAQADVGTTVTVSGQSYVIQQTDVGRVLTEGGTTVTILAVDSSTEVTLSAAVSNGASQTYSFNPNFVYQLSAAEKSQIQSGIKTWTASQLQNLLGAGLLKTTSSTLVTIGASIITANNVTLISCSGANIGTSTCNTASSTNSTGSIGQQTGQTYITLDGHNFSTDENIALNAAERTDVSYVQGVAIGGGPISVTFDASANTLTLPVGDNPTIETGQIIRVFGVSPSAPSGFAYYQVTGVTNNVIDVAAPAYDSPAPSPLLVSGTATVEVIPIPDPTIAGSDPWVPTTVNFVAGTSGAGATMARGATWHRAT